MGSRVWRRMSMPPVPALIPIAAVRPQRRRHSNNNTVDVDTECEPCGRDRDVDDADEDVRTATSSCGEDEDMPSTGGDGDREVVLQRSRRRPRQPHSDTEPIDATTPSRDWSGPQAPARRPRPERHRKSDRRRHKSDRLLRKRSTTTTTNTNTTAHTSQCAVEPSATKPHANPRVNPIFVWVRQEDNRIVDVKCEDYDKRNRILLTKTAHGWRAIPRTETLSTGTLEEAPADTAECKPSSRKPRSRKSGKTKRWRAVAQPEPEPPPPPPAWSAPADVESHLPSHTIPVPQRRLHDLANDAASVNSGETHAPSPECCAPSVVSGVSSPLDNLLAVAELEFKQHQEQECADGDDTPHLQHSDDDDDHLDEHEHPDFDMEQLNTLVEVNSEETTTGKTDMQEECDYNDDDENHMAMTDILDRLEQSLQSPMEDEHDPEHDADIDQEPEHDHEQEQEQEQEQEHDQEQEAVESEAIEDDTDDCYITEEDQQNAVDSTEEPQMLEHTENNQSEPEQEESKLEDMEEEQLVSSEHEYDTQITEITEILDTEQEREPEQSEQQQEPDQPTDLSFKSTKQTEKPSSEEDIYEDELPTDLCTRTNKEESSEATEEQAETIEADDMQPTDLCIRKICLAIDPPRPPSQNSETIQSPQPSGIPAVPPSPDLYPGSKHSTGTGSTKSLFLESLLSAASPKLALTPEVTITRKQNEPLDLGKSRKSASPTVSCSEEVKDEPATKRVKIEDITLKNLLHADKQKNVVIKSAETTQQIRQDKQEATNVETSRLLELLTSDNELDPLTQLKQLLADTETTIPDPLLVPKDRLSLILSSPAREIPRLLSQRPELRLPEALAYPQLLQDPDMLVITLAQLQTILHKQNQPISIEDTPKPINNNTVKEKEVKQACPVEKPSPKPQKPTERERERDRLADRERERERYQSSQPPQQQTTLQPPTPKVPNGLASEIDAATTAAFNQMLWLPYLNHLEAAALACGNNADFLKALNSICAPPGSYPSGLPDTAPPPMFPGGRFPGMPGTGFPPMQPQLDYTNPLELAMWQEAMMQANLQQQQQQQQQQRSNNMKQQTYRESMQFNNQKKYHSSSSSNQRVHSSARTSPISHTFHQQRIQSNGHAPPHPYGYPLPGMRHNLQIPQYNPSSLTHQQQAILQHHHQMQQQQQQQQQHQQQQQQAAAVAAAAKRSSSTSSTSSTNSSASYRKTPSSSEMLKQFQANSYNKYAYSKLHHQGIQSQQKVDSTPSAKPPRVTCKSLQNLLSPKRIEESSPKTVKPSQPMDLSGARPQVFSKLKVKQNLMDPVVASFGAKLWRHEDVPEVGSTTDHLHETQTHLWHPLFGK